MLVAAQPKQKDKQKRKGSKVAVISVPFTITEVVLAGASVVITGTVNGTTCQARVDASAVPTTGKGLWAGQQLVAQNIDLVPRQSANFPGLPFSGNVSVTV